MEPKTTQKPSRKLVVFKRELPFYLMLIPGVTFLIIFSYLPCSVWSWRSRILPPCAASKILPGWD